MTGPLRPARLLDSPVTVDDLVGSAALLGVLGVLGWLAAAVALSTVAAVPGQLGAAAGRAADVITPTLVRRAVAVTIGTVVAGGIVPAAASATTAAGGTAPAAAAGPSAARSTQGHAAVSVQAPARQPAGQPARQPELPSLDRPADPPAVTVAPGDCLWDLAARRLGVGASPAEITAEWQRWYAANLEVIGADPHLIHPGQRLQPPADRGEAP